MYDPFGKTAISHGVYPLVIYHSYIEHGPVEIVDLPIEHGGSYIVM